MKCEEWRDQALDVLYGEQVHPRECYRFFGHLEDCADCDREYRRLLEARELLSRWTFEDEPEAADLDLDTVIGSGSIAWWNRPLGRWLRQAAAAVLLTLGLFALLQQARLWGVDRVEVSEQELMEMVNDLIVQHEMSERRLIGREWMDFADEINLRHQALSRDVAQRLYELEARYLEQLEQNDQYMKALYQR